MTSPSWTLSRGCGTRGHMEERWGDEYGGLLIPGEGEGRIGSRGGLIRGEGEDDLEEEEGEGVRVRERGGLLFYSSVRTLGLQPITVRQKDSQRGDERSTIDQLYISLQSKSTLNRLKGILSRIDPHFSGQEPRLRVEIPLAAIALEDEDQVVEAGGGAEMVEVVAADEEVGGGDEEGGDAMETVPSLDDQPAAADMTGDDNEGQEGEEQRLMKRVRVEDDQSHREEEEEEKKEEEEKSHREEEEEKKEEEEEEKDEEGKEEEQREEEEEPVLIADLAPGGPFHHLITACTDAEGRAMDDSSPHSSSSSSSLLAGYGLSSKVMRDEVRALFASRGQWWKVERVEALMTALQRDRDQAVQGPHDDGGGKEDKGEGKQGECQRTRLIRICASIALMRQTATRMNRKVSRV